MQEVRYALVISRLENKKQLSSEVARSSKASSKVRVLLVEAKRQ